MFFCCLNDPCKCPNPVYSDECECKPADGAALVDGVPCQKCGAPLDVVEEPPEPSADQPRLRRVFIGLGVRTLKPGVRECWGAEPFYDGMRVERVMFQRKAEGLIQSTTERFEEQADAAIDWYGVRCGELSIDFGLPRRVELGRFMDIDPLYGRAVYVQRGQLIEVFIENPGDTPISVAGGFLGIANLPGDANLPRH